MQTAAAPPDVGMDDTMACRTAGASLLDSDVHRAAMMVSTLLSPLAAAEADLRALTALMSTRCTQSVEAIGEGVAGLLEEVTANGKDAVATLRAGVRATVKAADAAVEATMTTCDQLLLCSAVLEKSCGESGDDDAQHVRAARATAKQLLDASDHFPVPVLAVEFLSPEPAVLTQFYIRDGVAPTLCSATGPGLRGFVFGDTPYARVHNRVDIVLRDCHGEVISGPLPSEFLSVTTHNGICNTTSVVAQTDGSLAFFYCVTSLSGFGSNPAITVCAFGTPLSPHPWELQVLS